jgi:NADPH:quinone reductase-like Zn-dependent oxidoreductase
VADGTDRRTNIREEQMKAAYTEEAGGPEKIKVGDLPKPEPGPDGILVRNQAAAIGPWDWKMMLGGWVTLEFPHIPGYEAAGVVEQAPDGSGFKPGDEVWGRVRSAYAEYVVSHGASLVPKPSNVTFEEAASLVIAASTAYEGIIDRMKLQPHETILVTAAAGGVGTAAVQIAASTGARVIGVSSAGNRDYVLGLGADEVFDYNMDGWADAVREAVPGGVDVLFDAIGAQTGEQALTALRDGGRGAFIAWPQPDWQAAGRGLTGEGFSADASRERFEAINKLVEAGKLKPQVTATVPLEQTREALEKSQSGHTRGKVVLKI